MIPKAHITARRSRAVPDPWLGVPRRLLREGRVNLVYRFDSEDAPPLKLRLKVKINTREHFTELGTVRVPFRVDNPCFTGAAYASTCVLDELLCTKLRAQFEETLSGKRADPDFRDDVGPLLRPGFTSDFGAAMDAVLRELAVLLAGELWKGAEAS